MHEELVKRLRADIGVDDRAEFMKQAADAIEEMQLCCEKIAELEKRLKEKEAARDERDDVEIVNFKILKKRLIWTKADALPPTTAAMSADGAAGAVRDTD